MTHNITNNKITLSHNGNTVVIQARVYFLEGQEYQRQVKFAESGDCRQDQAVSGYFLESGELVSFENPIIEFLGHDLEGSLSAYLNSMAFLLATYPGHEVLDVSMAA